MFGVAQSNNPTFDVYTVAGASNRSAARTGCACSPTRPSERQQARHDRRPQRPGTRTPAPTIGPRIAARPSNNRGRERLHRLLPARRRQPHGGPPPDHVPHGELELGARTDTGAVLDGERWVRDGKVVTTAGISPASTSACGCSESCGPRRLAPGPRRDRSTPRRRTQRGAARAGTPLRSSCALGVQPSSTGALPVGADRGRALHPRAELGLRELRVHRLQLDAVGVAGLQVPDQHLAGDFVRSRRGDRK